MLEPSKTIAIRNGLKVTSARLIFRNRAQVIRPEFDGRSITIDENRNAGGGMMGTARAIPGFIETGSDAAKDAILRQLALQPCRPTELLSTLGATFTDFEVKETVLRLLREGTVLVTSDRRLMLAQAA